MQEIYLDANATTPVLPQAQAAALAVMASAFGNPSSVHSSGLKARALLDQTRLTARRVLGLNSGQLFFTSGATEGIQTAVLSALRELRRRRDVEGRAPDSLLYGATEHKAVPEALKHWNAVLGLGLEIEAIPVGTDGRHDLAWLQEHAGHAGLVCTMAANNETGVISDLDGIAAALGGSTALWLVDGVQALGKLALKLEALGVDYAPFSGHKLYAPKGIGMLYVRDGAPFTSLIAGGGQEGFLRAGTENMAGIVALGAVLESLDRGDHFADRATLAAYRSRLEAALLDAFPGLVFNAPPELCLPTTLNFSVPGLSAKLLLNLFDAAGVRVSGGSACSAAEALPSHVLQAMGLPDWQTKSAVRLSFGAAEDAAVIDEACRRLRACGESLGASCLGPVALGHEAAPELVTRFVVGGACCYLVADAVSRRCVVIDLVPEAIDPIARWLKCCQLTLAAVLDTRGHGDYESSARALLAGATSALRETGDTYAIGWPEHATHIELGRFRLRALPLPGHTVDATAYLLHDGDALQFVFVGDAVSPEALGRRESQQSEQRACAGSLRKLAAIVGRHTLLLPGHDHDDYFATTLAAEMAVGPLLAGGARLEGWAAAESVELTASALAKLHSCAKPRLVDVRERYERHASAVAGTTLGVEAEAVPLSVFVNSVSRWCAGPAGVPLVFVCRSGNRSAQAARTLRRLGIPEAWSLAGGLANLPADDAVPAAVLP